MIIFHDKDGNRLAMTEAEALALGYTYEHIWKRVNPNRTSLNANELIEFQGNKASEAKANGFSGERFMQTATMLRQLQAEIEALKAEIEEAKLAKKVILRYAEKDIAKYRAEVEELKKQLALWRLSKSSEEIEQSNPTSVGGLDEPVAWMRKEDKDTFFSAIDHSLNSKWIPLFIHPADLTDEEIAEVYEKCEWASGYVYWKEFARAILRKAQEK